MEGILSSLKEEIDLLMHTGRQVVIAIDGNCASGKSTLADYLEREYDCNVFHMDDFFLRPEQRTAERYAEPGGNIDYERFWEEVLIPLQKEQVFSYRPFSCSTFTLSNPVQVCPKQLNIVEGTYSQHPYFGEIYDLKVFMRVSGDMQRRRILKRPAFLQNRFFREWIPMENQYFESFRVCDRCDLILDLTGMDES